MRGAILAVAVASMPATALAQTTGSASGTLLDETPATSAATAEAPAQPAAQTPPAETPPAAAAPPTSVAAPGISVTHSGETASHGAPHTSPPASATHGAAGNAPSAAQHAAASHALIQPVNDLERAFVNAAQQENQRAAFRRIFLDSQVALATVSADDNAAPRLIRLGPAGDACLIFTSDARATQIMGANSPRRMMTGREALQRLRGAHLVIININLDPYLTLDAAGIESFLGANAAPAAPPRSAGPAQ